MLAAQLYGTPGALLSFDERSSDADDSSASTRRGQPIGMDYTEELAQGEVRHRHALFHFFPLFRKTFFLAI